MSEFDSPARRANTPSEFPSCDVTFPHLCLVYGVHQPDCVDLEEGVVLHLLPVVSPLLVILQYFNTWSARGQHMVNTLSTHGQRVVSMRSTRGQLVVNTWSTHGQYVVNMWSTCGQHVVNTWSTRGQHEFNMCQLTVNTWSSRGQHKVSP